MKTARELDPVDLIGEGLRVLKRLVAPGSKLERRNNFYALIGTGRAGRSLHVPFALVDAFRRREWLAREAGVMRGEEALVLSDVGLGWLRRTLGGDDPFLAQHATLAVNETADDNGVAKTVVVNESESPLARLRSAAANNGTPLIDEAQYLAGERLRRDFTLANLMPRLAVDLTAPVVSGRRGAQQSELTDIAVAARQRFSRATDALGNDLAGVAVDVCCHLKELDAAGSGGWPPSAALVVLRLALDRLAHHYGFVATGAGGRTRAWRAPEEDAAPELPAKKSARDPRA